VKKTPSTGWATSALPVAAAPVTTWKTPGGSPASSNSAPMARPVRAANSEGLYSTALPVSSAARNTLEPTKYG
jgi:hypothetical protein